MKGGKEQYETLCYKIAAGGKLFNVWINNVFTLTVFLFLFAKWLIQQRYVSLKLHDGVYATNFRWQYEYDIKWLPVWKI